MRKLLKFITSRMFIVGFLIFIQATVLTLTIWKLSNYFVYCYAGFILLSLTALLWLLNKNDNPSYKLAWAIPILLFPVFGGLFYLMFGTNRASGKFIEQRMNVYNATIPLLKQDEKILDEIKYFDKNAYNQSQYISQTSHYPIFKNTTTKYLPLGEIKWEAMKEELRKAEHYIFMEYFIIEEGKMWDEIFDILVDKVKQGVEVRVMYDDVGCLNTLPYKYNKKLESLGIKCHVFNPFRPSLNIIMNNRDHRKITVIDGHTAFTGGINLADEYINAYAKHGHWKDAAVLIKGEAVWGFTMMFLQAWTFSNELESDWDKYRPNVHHVGEFENDGYVQPFGDSPLDREIVAENVYLNMINKANDYIYINTPYLIIDNELVTALALAAKSGIDVRIVTPHVADKWFVHIVTQAYYPQLIEAGVKIYEYTPGFIHAKTFVCDDEYGVIGTINLDYRSLYLHFECGVWLYKTKSVTELKEDFLDTLNICTPISLEDCHNKKFGKTLLCAILKSFAPLM